MAGERPGQAWVASFLTQALANALGTLISGALLGSFAVRIGLIEVDEDAAQLTADVAVVAGALLVCAFVLALPAYWLLNVAEPARRQRRKPALVKVYQAILILGIAATTAFYAPLLLTDFDLEGLFLYLVQVGVLGILLAVATAYGRRLRAASPPEVGGPGDASDGATPTS